MNIVILAGIFVAIVAVFTAIDRAVFHPIAQHKNIDDTPEYKRSRGMAQDMGLLVVIAALMLLIIAATR